MLFNINILILFLLSHLDTGKLKELYYDLLMYHSPKNCDIMISNNNYNDEIKFINISLCISHHDLIFIISFCHDSGNNITNMSTLQMKRLMTKEFDYLA